MSTDDEISAPALTGFPIDDGEFIERVATAAVACGSGRWQVALTGGAIIEFSVLQGVGLEPKAGSLVRIYGIPPAEARGLFVDGRCLFYRTVGEEAERLRTQALAREDRMRENFARDQPELDRRVGALPDVFRRRIERFRAGSPEFRWRFEAVELFVCEQAAMLGDHFRLRGPRALGAWAAAPLAEKRRQVPGLGADHTPITLAAAVALARAYVWDPLKLAKAHGALVMFGGCELYGCHPKPVAKA